MYHYHAWSGLCMPLHVRTTTTPVQDFEKLLICLSIYHYHAWVRQNTRYTAPCSYHFTFLPLPRTRGTCKNFELRTTTTYEATCKNFAFIPSRVQEWHKCCHQITHTNKEKPFEAIRLSLAIHSSRFSEVILNALGHSWLRIPPPVLCLTVARGCKSEWCLLLCGHVVDIRETFQVLVGRMHNFKLAFCV
jgi:hypothetical protein